MPKPFVTFSKDDLVSYSIKSEIASKPFAFVRVASASRTACTKVSKNSIVREYTRRAFSVRRFRTSMKSGIIPAATRVSGVLALDPGRVRKRERRASRHSSWLGSSSSEPSSLTAFRVKNMRTPWFTLTLNAAQMSKARALCLARESSARIVKAWTVLETGRSPLAPRWTNSASWKAS